MLKKIERDLFTKHSTPFLEINKIFWGKISRDRQIKNMIAVLFPIHNFYEGGRKNIEKFFWEIF